MRTLEPLANTLLIVSPIITLGYFAMCLLWPYRSCRRCAGFGQFRGPFGGIRPCGHCDGTGLRLRFGRRVTNAIRRIYRDLNEPHDR